MKANCMQPSDNNLEILAPAGNMESLKCAVNNGADAVYLGLKKFNARAKAGNFSTEELREAVEYCRFFGVKVYVTFNTIYKKNEYDEVIECIKQCSDIGVNAFILHDFALISRIKSTMPDIVLHLSTQAGVHNLDGALAAEKLGFTRVILSRETLISDIEKIRKNTSLEIEAFVQGALCVSFSGNCYFSSLVSGYSGNRGKCMQLCRKKYSFKNKKAYWLSPKDVCMRDEMQKLIAAGVSSFKIEGRMRRPEYVGEAVNCYKSALENKKYDLNRLKKMYNRGDYTQVYVKNDLEDVIYPYTQNHIGKAVGTVKSLKGRYALLSCPLSKGDGIKFMRGNMEIGSASVSSDGVKTGFTGKVLPGDEVRITTDKKLCDEVLSKKRLLDFDLAAKVDNGKIELSLTCGNVCETIVKDGIEPAKNNPLTEKDVIIAFTKTDDKGFRLRNADISINQSVFLAKSQLNELRRQALGRLRQKIIALNAPQKNKARFENVFENLNYFVSPEKCVIAAFDNADTANKCAELYDYVAFSPSVWNADVTKQLKSLKKPYLLVLPNVIRGKDAELIQGVLNGGAVENVIVNNISGITTCKDKKILFGPLMNMITDEIKCSKILSIESKNVNPENFVYVFGRFPLMTFCHCPFKTYAGKCLNCKNPPSESLIDEYGHSFTLQSYRLHYCYCRLLSDNPVNLVGSPVRTQRFFVDLIGFNAEKCYNILESVQSGQKLPGGTLAFYNKSLE